VALRALSVLATLVIPASALVLAEYLPWSWLLPCLAAAVALPLLFARPKAIFSILIGAGLAALSAKTIADAHDVLTAASSQDDWPTYDLTDGSLPEDASGYVTLRGHFRSEWTLDEYRVQEGARPDQNEDASAVLVPFLGSTDEVVVPQGRIVIARVPPRLLARTGVQSLQGRIEPAAPGILDHLLEVDASVDRDQLSGVVLDATALPSSQDAWTQTAIALVASLLGLALLWLAVSGDPARKESGDSGQSGAKTKG
jgi:hypothetical protein